MNPLRPPRTIALATLSLLLSCSSGQLPSNGNCPPAGACCPAGVICRTVPEPERMPEKLLGTSVDDAPIKAGTMRAKRASVLQLNYRVLDAGFSAIESSEINAPRFVGRLAMISNSPSNALHIVKVHDGSDLVVPLPGEPRSQSVVPWRQAVAIGFDRGAMSLDLITGTEYRTCPVSVDFVKVGASNRGWIYVVPKRQAPPKVLILDLDYGCFEREITGIDGNFENSPGIAVHPAGEYLFLAGSGGRITSCRGGAASETSCRDTQDPSDWGKYDLCNDVLPVLDGTRLFTGCGVVLNVEGRTDVSTCSYAGRFGGVVRAKHLFEAKEAGRVTMIPAPSDSSPGAEQELDDDTVVEIYDTKDLTIKGRYGLPQVPLAAGSALAHGRFAFSDPKLSKIYVVADVGRAGHGDRTTVVVTLEL